MNCKLWIVNCKQITVHYSARIMNSELWTLIQLHSTLPDHITQSVFRHPPPILHVREHGASYQMTKSNCQFDTFFQGLPETGVLLPDSFSDTCKDFIVDRIHVKKFLEKSKDPSDGAQPRAGHRCQRPFFLQGETMSFSTYDNVWSLFSIWSGLWWNGVSSAA